MKATSQIGKEDPSILQSSSSTTASISDAMLCSDVDSRRSRSVIRPLKIFLSVSKTSELECVGVEELTGSQICSIWARKFNSSDVFESPSTARLTPRQTTLNAFSDQLLSTADGSASPASGCLIQGTKLRISAGMNCWTRKISSSSKDCISALRSMGWLRNSCIAPENFRPRRCLVVRSDWR